MRVIQFLIKISLLPVILIVTLLQWFFHLSNRILFHSLQYVCSAVPADCRALLPDGDFRREGINGDDCNRICDLHGSGRWDLDRDAHHCSQYEDA